MTVQITIDGIEEHSFRRSIENMLRQGLANEAACRLRALLREHAGTGALLPARMLEITAGDIRLEGWEELAARIAEYDRPENPITALGIGIADPEDTGLRPDENGFLSPPLQTTYFSDSAYPFSEADREDLLDGYSSFGCEWQGDFEHTDQTLSVGGIADLYGAVAALENKVSQSDNPSATDIEAGAVGACYLGVLVYQALRDAILRDGLPRPMAVLLVNSDAYPFFDAPVMTCGEYLDGGEIAIVESSKVIQADEIEPAPMASLETVIDKAQGRKKPVLVLDPADDDPVLISLLDEPLTDDLPPLPTLPQGAHHIQEPAEPAPQENHQSGEQIPTDDAALPVTATFDRDRIASQPASGADELETEQTGTNPHQEESHHLAVTARSIVEAAHPFQPGQRRSDALSRLRARGREEQRSPPVRLRQGSSPALRRDGQEIGRGTNPAPAPFTSGWFATLWKRMREWLSGR